MTARMWLYLGGIGAALVVILLVAILVGTSIQAQSSGDDTAVVRITGSPGVNYAGTISSPSEGRKDITGSVREDPEEYTTPSNAQVVASVNKDPKDKGMLRVALYVDGDVVDSASDDSGVAPLTVYFAGGDH